MALPHNFCPTFGEHFRCRALQLTGSACQIVKRALQLIRDGGQVMSVRKKALDREGCFYYALALGIDLGRLSAKG